MSAQPPRGPVRAVISDFGGVLTSPLSGTFARMQERSGIATAQLGEAMAAIAAREGSHPLFELEKGRVSEADFLAALERELAAATGEPVHLKEFAAAYFSELHPNETMIGHMRALRDRGLRMALLTNNVREWEPLWRSMLPVDEIFEIVVDSAFVGMRKPEPGIYELTLQRLGLEAGACLFVDDVEVNCEAARELGMRAVHFRETEQAIGELEAALDQFSTPSRSQQ